MSKLVAVLLMTYTTPEGASYHYETTAEVSAEYGSCSEYKEFVEKEIKYHLEYNKYKINDFSFTCIGG